MTKYCIDASALIAPWHDFYTPLVFPGVWKELIRARESMVFIQGIFDEIEPVLPDRKEELSGKERKEKYLLRDWLFRHRFDRIVQNPPPEAAAGFMELEEKYQIEEAESKGKGISLNDIHLVAFARHIGGCVVTQEATQKNRPGNIHNYKIPLICKDEGVDCINLTGMLERLGAKFA